MTDSGADDPQRNAALASLDRLVGRWEVSGPDGLRGTVRFEWLDGRRGFLVQHVQLTQTDGDAVGVEYIGWHPERHELASHYFGSDGHILEYTWQVTPETLTISFGTPDSPARYVGTFGDGGATNAGGWEWPGGGYRSTMTRVPDRPPAADQGRNGG
jgi:hypothetical protein